MVKAFSEYNCLALLVMDNATLNDAIRIEAIKRGIAPPMLLSEALQSTKWVGYTAPADGVKVFEVLVSGQYGSPCATGLCYLDEAKATAALEGALYFDADTYGTSGGKIYGGGASIIVRVVGTNHVVAKAAQIQQYIQDTKAFNEVVADCLAKLAAVRQADYDDRLNKEKQAEYLRLAGGNEEVARAFWAKVEKTAWPEPGTISPTMAALSASPLTAELTATVVQGDGN